MEKLVTFTNSKGDKLSGVLSLPQKDYHGLIVIFAHGLGSSKESDKYKDFGKLLKAKNIGMLRFDFYGHGESEGEFADVTIDEGMDDVLNAVDFVKRLGFTKVGLVGTSFGGISSIMAASKAANLKFLGLLVPVSIPEKLAHLRSTETARLRKPLESDTINNGHKVAGKIKIPVYIIHGEKDETVPLEHSIKFCSLLPNCQLEIIKGGDHRLRSPGHYKRVLKFMTEFIVSHSS